MLMKNPKIFISRDLSKEHLLFRELSKQPCTFFASSLIQFSAVPFSIPLDVDACFFYSKNGVRFFFDQYEIVRASFSSKKSKKSNGLTKIAFGCFGKSTAEELAKYGYESQIIGSSDLGQTASEIATLWTGKKVIFPQATHSRNSLQLLTDNFIKYLPLIVYDNVPKSEVLLPFATDVLIFTSPLNVLTYQKLGFSFSGKIIISIGATTSNQLARFTKQQIFQCVEPSERAILDLLTTKFIFPKK